MPIRLIAVTVVVAALCTPVLVAPAYAAPAARAPRITSFTPGRGYDREIVTINGSGFAGATAVAFHGQRARHFRVISASKITATVAAGTTTGPITVRTQAGTARSARSFTVLATPAPKVALSPTSGPPGTVTTVSGSGFGVSETVDVYFDTTDEVLASTNSKGSFKISVPVPASATPGGHWVTADGRHSNLSAQSSFLVQANWPEFGGGLTGRSFNTTENVLNVGNVAGLNVDWTSATGQQVESSPAVVNGTVYVGSADKRVYAINAATGKQLWTFPTGQPVLSSPAVVKGVVYVGSVDGHVYAINAATGKQNWIFATGDLVLSSPAVTNGVVYIGSNDGNMYAINSTTGKQIWKFPTGAVIHSSPVVAYGLVYFGSENDNVYAVNAATGAQVWSYPTGNEVFASATVANGLVYIGSLDGSLYALSALKGTVVWSFTAPGPVPFGSPAAVARGIVYVANATGSAGTFFALNGSTGAVLWSHSLGPIASKPTVANGVVYVTSEDGSIRAFDAISGSPLWTYFTSGTVTQSSPAVVNGVVYVGSNDFNVYAFSLNGGAASPHVAHRPDPATLRPNLRLRVRY